MSAARTFLSALFPDLNEINGYLLICVNNNFSHWCKSIEDAEKRLAENAARDVYVGCCLRAKDLGPFVRGRAQDCSHMPGFWVDIDCRTEYRNDAKYPASYEEAMKILPEDAPPTLVVASQGGIHAWWLFDELYSFDEGQKGDEQREAMAQLLKRWQTILRNRAAVNGWHLDYTHDLPRHLRVPGTASYKIPNQPVMVALRKSDGRRYDIRELAEIIEETEAVSRELGAPQAVKRAMPDGKPVKYLDQTYTAWDRIQVRVGEGASVHPDMIEQLCQIDPRFKATWHKDRPDINGQGNEFSEYDMALANFGVKAEMPPQMIVAMMVQFRREHGGKPKFRLDYYQRTLFEAMRFAAAKSSARGSGVIGNAGAPPQSTAVQNTSGGLADEPEGSNPEALTNDIPKPTVANSGDPAEETPLATSGAPEAGGGNVTAPSDLGDDTPPDWTKEDDSAERKLRSGVLREGLDYRVKSESERAEMLRICSDWLGLRIMRLVKITGREPSYLLDLEVGRVEIPSTGKLVEQGALFSLIAAATDILPERMGRNDYERMVRILLGACIARDGGAENETVGDAKQYLQSYLMSRPFISDLKTVNKRDLRQPAILDGKIAVNITDVQLYLQREFNRKVQIRDITFALSSLGAETKRWRVRGMEQSRWLLPTYEFDPKEYVSGEEISAQTA